MSDEDLKYLNRKWTHSFEEDTGNEMVYRPDDFTLPRSRGRTQFNLKEDGTVMDVQIGRNDVPDAVIGSWNIENDSLILKFSDGKGQCYPVKEVTLEKLVLKKEK